MKLKQYILARDLGTYLALAFCALSIVLTLVLVAVVEQTATEQIKTTIGHGLAELSMQTSEKLDHDMFERYREVSLMAQRSDLAAPDTSIEERRKVLDSMRETYSYYAWIGMTDINGKVTVAARGLLEGADVSKRSWFSNALHGIYVGDVHEAVLLSNVLPNGTNELKRFVDVAFPYRDKNGQAIGVLGAHLYWQWAKDIERSIIQPIASHRQVESLIIGTDGVVLLGPMDLQGKKVNQPSFDLAQKHDANYVVEKWPDGHSYLVGFSKCKGYDDYAGLGWTVLVRQNIDDAYLPVKDIRQKALWSGTALAVLFSLLGIVAARRITKPLEKLTQSAQRIERDEKGSITPEADTYFEVKALSGSLNALVSSLMQSKQELRALNQTLEKRVEERTHELEQALVAVRANEQRVNTVIEAAQDAFVGFDLNGMITDWNTQAECMFGWSREDALDRSAAELMLPERFRDSFYQSLAVFKETGELNMLGRRVEQIVMHRHGKEFPVEITAALAGSDEKHFFSAFLHDISERKKVEQMKNEFISTVSHELRTPLTSIRASLAMLADGTAGELPADIKSLIDIANQSCERLVRLVSDVLDIEKIESGNMEFERSAQELLPLIDHAMEGMQGYAHHYGVTLEREVEKGAMQLMAEVDRDRMTQVLTNLMSNAIKFSRTGGKVKVCLTARNGRARLSVVDHGSGIPEHFRQRIFQRFAQADSADTRQKGGTGLGLSICKSIVEEHGGTIGFDSTEGVGTSFHVDLPLVESILT